VQEDFSPVIDGPKMFFHRLNEARVALTIDRLMDVEDREANEEEFCMLFCRSVGSED
jgi:hypothetical protein